MGGQHQNIIEINGKKYDAVTGALVGAHTSETKTPTIQTQKPIQPKGVALDGFVKTRKPVSTQKIVHPSRTTDTHHAHKKIQKSATLHRKAVKKPVPSSEKQATHQQQISKSQVLTPAHRTFAAKHVEKSPMISKFGSGVQHTSSVVKKVQPMSVKQPTAISHQQVDTAQSTHQKALISNEHHRTLSNHQKTAKMLDTALANATSHLEPSTHHTKKKRLSHKFGISPRAMALSSSVLAGVLLIGFFAIQNIPNLSMRVAATRAGVAASLPSYQPAGFGFSGPIDYSNGVVKVSFKSRTDDRNYTITQKSSTWNSDALLSEFVASGNQQYQTYLDRGRTLYIYNGSNATWVDNGIWYQVEGDSDMTTDQLVRIAASM